MRRVIPIIVGVTLLLVGVGSAPQGAGIIGGSSLMDNNAAFIYLGGSLVAVGIALMFFGAISKTKVRISADTRRPRNLHGDKITIE